MLTMPEVKMDLKFGFCSRVRCVSGPDKGRVGSVTGIFLDQFAEETNSYRVKWDAPKAKRPRNWTFLPESMLETEK